MKKVRIILEAIVPEFLLKDETEILDEYDSYDEAASMDGLDAFIDGSYHYTCKCEIIDI